MEYLREKLLNLLRILFWCLDYLAYLIFNPFKFKPLPKDVKSILIIEQKYIGDIIVATPAIHALKAMYKDAKIDVAVPESMRGLLKYNPDVNEIVVFGSKPFLEKLALIKNKYDLAVIFHNGTFAISLLLLLARVKFRIGCTKVGILESKGYFLHRNTKPTFKLKHKVNDNLDVIKLLNIDASNPRLYLYPDKAASKKITKILAKNKINKNDFLVVIHSKPQHKSHEWFPDRFAELADNLIKQYGAKIILTGAEKDKSYNKEILRLMKNKALNCAGTSLSEFISLINMAKLIISVDTGAMHIAAAFDKPVISLFGVSKPVVWRPYCKSSVVICKSSIVHTFCAKHNCYLKGKRYMECMKAITTDDVLQGIRIK